MDLGQPAAAHGCQWIAAVAYLGLLEVELLLAESALQAYREHQAEAGDAHRRYGYQREVLLEPMAFFGLWRSGRSDVIEPEDFEAVLVVLDADLQLHAA